MKINFGLITIVTVMVCVTGCISTKKFNALQANYNKLQDANSQLTREVEECKNNLDRANIDLITTKYDYVLRTKILDFYQNKQLW